MGLFTWILVGLVAGFAAEFVLGGAAVSLRGMVITTLIGIGGALLGGFISVALGYGDVTGFNVRSLFIAFAGALAVIIAVRAVSGRGGNRGLI